MEILCKYDELVDIKKIKVDPKNRNNHPTSQIDRLAEILKYQGIRAPLVISKQTGILRKGHGTLRAMIKNKATQAPVVYQSFKNIEQEYAFAVSDNAIANWAELDLAGIHTDLPEFDPKLLDIDMLGIENFEFEPNPIDPQYDEDEVPEKVEAKTKLGDMYKLGEHRLLCGDVNKDIQKLINNEIIDVCYTDPPYGMGLNTNYDKMFSNDKSRKIKGDRFDKVIGDEKYFDPTLILSDLRTVPEVFMWGADYFYDSLPRGGSFSAWDKRNETLDAVIGNTTEFLWSKIPHRRLTARVLWSGHHGMGKDDDKKRIHPTQKPITLHEWFFENYGKNFKSVLDLFGGSGSTMIACEKTNRKCYMMELDPHYCDVIVARWEKYTGKKAELLKSVRK